MQNHVSDALLRLPTVLSIIPVSRASWYRGIASGRYPSPVKLSDRVSAWRASDIQTLIANFGISTLLLDDTVQFFLGRFFPSLF